MPYNPNSRSSAGPRDRFRSPRAPSKGGTPSSAAELVLAGLLILVAPLALVVPATLAQGAPSASGDALPPRPEGVDPLPEERRATLAPLIAEAERYRGLEAGAELPVGYQTKEALGRHLDRQLDEEVPEDLAPIADRVIEIFGWIPGDVDLIGEMRRLLGEQVAGYFDPETGYLVIVEDALEPASDDASGDATKAEARAEDEAEQKVMNDAVMVHEIGHYLQHRHFDLETLMKGEEDDEVFFSDEAGARAALIEGDATHLMFSQMMGLHLERIPGFTAGIGQLLTNPDNMASMSPDLASDQALAEAPTFLREEMIFPYMSGLLFVTAVRDEGGQPLVDHAFAHDAPRSTEQILHPEKWLGDPETGRRDTPIEIDLPQLESMLGERRLVGTWGELDLRIGLRIHLGDDQRERAEAAAAGWGGDIFAFYGDQDGKPETLAWITEWDSAADAEEFAQVAREIWGDSPDWRLGAAGTRVALLYGQIPADFVRPIERALFGTRARRPIEPAVDLAKLGIDATALPGLVPPDELMATMEASPFGQAMGGDLSGVEAPENLDVEAMLEDPEVRDLAQEEAQKALQAMKEQGPLEVKFDGTTHRLPALGLSLTAPESEWTVFDLAQFPAEPKPSLMLTNADGVVIVVLAIPTPMAAPPDAVVAGMRMSMPGLEVSSQENLEGEPSGFELDYTFSQEGALLRSLHRYYHLEGTMVSVQGMSRNDLWEQTESSIRGLLASVRFDSPAAAADP